MPRLHVLGGGAWVPTPQRQTSSLLIETRRALIFLGCGSGLCRLHDPMFQLLLERHQRVVILLSHYRLDHVVGLSYLPHFFRDHELIVGAPPREASDVEAAEACDRLLAPPFFRRPLSTWSELFPRGFELRELRKGRNNLLGEKVAVSVLPGEPKGVLMRVRDVAWVSGCGVREESIEAASGAAILAHDGHLDREDSALGSVATARHGVAPEVAHLAQKAGVCDLLLSDINPGYGFERLDRMLLDTCTIFPRTLIASDMMSQEIKGEDEPSAGEEASEGASEPGTPAPPDSASPEEPPLSEEVVGEERAEDR